MDDFNDDATFSAPGCDLHGKDEIVRFYQESAAAFPSLSVEVGHVMGSRSNAAIEWRAAFTTPTVRTVRLHGVNMIETANGKFEHVRVYYDPQELDQES